MKSLPYRPNVCLLILNKNKQLFIGERLNSKGDWQLPQGGLENNLSEEENALREAVEELGLANIGLLKIKTKLKTIYQYDWQVPPDYAINKWRGQSQIFYVLSFLGLDSDITLQSDKPEFSNWKWCDINEVLLKVEPKRRPGYNLALEELKKII